MKPLVSIIILNWNGKPFIFDCIKSVQKQTYTNIEVIFVDNNSNDDSLKECKQLFPDFSYVEHECNLGFAAGMNSGVSQAKGKYCLLLNTDVYLAPDYIAKCVDLLESNSEICCTAGLEYKWRYPILTDEKVGHGTFGIALHLRIIDCKPRLYDFGVSGSFPIFRTDTIHEIKAMRGFFFDEMFETGWEDSELRFLLAHMGKKTKLCANTKAWHIGSAADNGNVGVFQKNIFYQKRIYRNRFYIIEKYIKGNYIIWPLYINAMNMLIYIYMCIRHKASIPALKEAKIEYNSNIDQIINQRKEMNNLVKHSKFNFLRHIVSF